MVPDWINESHLELFPEELQALAGIIGFDNLIKLMDTYRSTELYIPKIESITAIVRNRQICREFNGSNQRALANKYQLSSRYIYIILAKAREQKLREAYL